MSNNKIKVYGYVRVSSELQVKKDNSNGRFNLMNEIFGDNLSDLLKWLKGYSISVDYLGRKRSYIGNYDKDESYKNISKILGLIEVDVIEYLEKRFLKDEFYIKIFDGFMIQKRDYMDFRLKMNMILKSEVGYMFELR